MLKGKKCCPTIPYRKVTHVIFDLDGTVIDTETMIEEVLIEICNKCEREWRPSLHNKTAGSIVEDIAKFLIPELELNITLSEFVQLYNEFTRTKCADINFMPGARELIEHFHKHNIPIAVATSSAEDLMLLKTERYRKVFDLFHHIVCGGSDPDVKSGKPSPDIFLVCASRFDDNPDPENCLVLEDAPNGIKGATRAGMQTVMIPQDDVPYEIWNTATLRLDTLEFMAPELFGLPPLINTACPLPKLSFTMHYEIDLKGIEKQKEGEKEKQKGKELTPTPDITMYDDKDSKEKEEQKGKEEIKSKGKEREGFPLFTEKEYN